MWLSHNWTGTPPIELVVANPQARTRAWTLRAPASPAETRAALTSRPPPLTSTPHRGRAWMKTHRLLQESLALRVYRPLWRRLQCACAPWSQTNALQLRAVENANRCITMFCCVHFRETVSENEFLDAHHRAISLRQGIAHTSACTNNPCRSGADGCNSGALPAGTAAVASGHAHTPKVPVLFSGVAKRRSQWPTPRTWKASHSEPMMAPCTAGKRAWTA